jgi:hypothetical protein
MSRLEHPEHRRDRHRSLFEQQRDRPAVSRSRIEYRSRDPVRQAVQLAIAPSLRSIGDRKRRGASRRLRLEARADRLLNFSALKPPEGIARPGMPQGVRRRAVQWMLSLGSRNRADGPGRADRFCPQYAVLGPKFPRITRPVFRRFRRVAWAASRSESTIRRRLKRRWAGSRQ